MVTPDWRELRIPLVDANASLSPGRLTRPLHLAQKGWTLTLPAGWQLSKAGSSWVATP